MSRLRRVLGPLVAVWLLCQAGSVAHAWVAAAEDCACPHGVGAVCPMHNPAGGAAKRAKGCAMRSTDDSAALTLASLLAPAAPIPAPIAASSIPAIDSTVTADPALAGLRPVPPDPPPPRA